MESTIDVGEAAHKLPPTSDGTAVPEHADAKSIDFEEIDSWRDFTKKTTFHGIQYIFEKRGLKFRRRIWLLVVLTALSVFVIQVGIRTGNYFEHKTTLDVGQFYKDRLEFPAVTICNQNRHRITAVVEHGLYDVIDEVYKAGNISEIPWKKFGDRVDGIDYGEFTRQTGHQKHSFIDSCTWNGIDCDIDQDFKAVITDLGLCYTFNGQHMNTLQTLKAGAGSGLKLVINVEQYEYMRGPQNDAGIKILLHSHKETPIIQEQGFAAAPGSHTLVAMRRSEVTTLQPPYGVCHPDNSPVSQCHARCQAHEVIKACQCQTEYMQSFDKNAKITCDFKTTLSCVRQTLAEMTKSELQCDCKPPCEEVLYEPQLSYAQLSKFNIDRLILGYPVKQKRLEESHLKALETTQHYSDDIKEKDTRDMTTLVSIAERLRSSLQYICKKTAYTFTDSKDYDLPAIIFPQPYQNDFFTIIQKLSDLIYPAHDAFHLLEISLLSDLKAMEDRFLVWDGSVFRFQQFLSKCIKEASASQQNNSADGSGDVDLDLLYVSPQCKKEIQDKADIWDDVIVFLDFHQYELRYMKSVESIYKDSTKSPDAFNQHKACMYVLGSESVKQAYLDFYHGLQNVSKVQTLEDYNLSTNNMLPSVKVLIAARDNITMCEWIRYILRDFQNQVLDQNPTLQRIDKLRNSLEIMSKTMAYMDQALELHVRPLLDMITGYMNENVTKIELATRMSSPYTTNAIGELAEYESSGYIVINSLQEELIHVKKTFSSMYSIYQQIAESPLPVLTVDQFQNLEFFKLSYTTNNTDFQHLIYGLTENMTNVQTLLDLVFSEYELSCQECLDAMAGGFREMVDRLTTLRDNLHVYADAASLNVNFFMENFLQLDIFYKDMSYQVITQQEAFGVLSLLGEVGGFLGLLLGASVLTVCELLDYILLQLAAKCARRRVKEQCDVENVKSAEKD